MLMIFFMACAQSLLGTWTGTCKFDDGNLSHDMVVEAEVWRDNGYIVEGDMRLLDWNDKLLVSPLDGDYTGKYVLFKADIEEDDSTYQFRVEGERLGSLIQGQCIIRISDGSGAAGNGLMGDILLER